MKEKFKNMKGQLEIMKTLGIKPNFSELERTLGIERHTIKKYYDVYEGKSPIRNKPSKLDKYYEEIKTKIIALEEVGISEINIAQVKCTKIEDYKNETRAMAMKDAHKKAKTLTDAIGQPLGKAIYISESDYTNVRNYPRLMMSKAAGPQEEAAIDYEMPDINFEKIKVESRVQVKFEL